MKDFDITDSSSFASMKVMEALRTVIDPELQINVVDLGLIYGVEVRDEKKEIQIEMTLSSQYCPMGEAILQSVKNCAEEFFPGYTADVNLVWEPVWSFENISEEGRRLLGR